MIFLLDCLRTILPVVAAFVLYVIYCRLHIEGYVKRIKIAFDNNEQEKAEMMREIALKKQPIKMPSLLIKYGLNQENNKLNDFEIEAEQVENQDSVSIDVHLKTKDMVQYHIWYLLHQSPKTSRTILLVLLIVFVIVSVNNLITEFSASYLSAILVLVAIVLYKWIKLYSIYSHYPKSPVRISFRADNFLFNKNGKSYLLGYGLIKKINTTKRYIYVVAKNELVFIIPKRSLTKSAFDTIMSCMKK